MGSLPPNLQHVLLEGAADCGTALAGFRPFGLELPTLSPCGVGAIMPCMPNPCPWRLVKALKCMYIMNLRLNSHVRIGKKMTFSFTIFMFKARVFVRVTSWWNRRNIYRYKCFFSFSFHICQKSRVFTILLLSKDSIFFLTVDRNKQQTRRYQLSKFVSVCFNGHRFLSFLKMLTAKMLKTILDANFYMNMKMLNSSFET